MDDVFLISDGGNKLHPRPSHYQDHTKGKGRMPAVHRSQVSWTKMRAQPALVGYNVVNPMTAIPNRGLLGIHLLGDVKFPPNGELMGWFWL